MLDYIIVGQGIAGSVLALELLKKGKQIVVIDNNYYNSSSKGAAGLSHPMSFKRTILSWNAENLSQYSIDYYQKLEKKLDAKFYEPLDFVRIFGSIEEQNNWFSKQTETTFKDILLDTNHTLEKYPIKSNFGGGKVNQSFRLHLTPFLKAVKGKLESLNSFRKDKFGYNKLVVNENRVEYDGLVAKGIVFCEGHQYRDNPLFNYLPKNLTKGEVLKIKIEDFPTDFALSKGCFLLPIKGNEYLLGATYDRRVEDCKITTRAKGQLIEKLENLTDEPYEVDSQWAGIRPTTLNRKPILGTHPKYNNVHLFNGMGSKGVQIAPYYANHFCGFLESNLELASEVSVSRFTEKYYKE